MSQVTNKPRAARRNWKLLYAPICAELAEVEVVLRREQSSPNPQVDKLLKQASRLGGKRLRPAMLLLCAKAAGSICPQHITLAAVVEMIHTATLVHDDILDEATLRRHRETVNASSGNEASVLVGDFLFTHAFSLASSLETTFACQTIGRATNVVCAGEMRQIQNRGNFDLSEAEYLEIIAAKTAELCACCCTLGAHYAGAAPAVVSALERFGRGLGTAFQIADDLLDVIGEETLAGKSLGTDLQKEKPTLPLIRLLAQCGPHQREKLVSVLRQRGGNRRAMLEDWLARGDALQYARAKAQFYARAAEQELSCLEDTPAREVLAQLTHLAVARRE